MSQKRYPQVAQQAVVGWTGSGAPVLNDSPSLLAPLVTGSINDAADQPILEISGQASAVEYATLTNAASGNAPSLGVASAGFEIFASGGDLALSSGFSDVTVDAAGDVLLTPAGDAYVNGDAIVTEADPRIVDTGTAFPGSPVEGQLFYRTDLDELFKRESTRGKWLSVRTFVYEGAAAAGISSGTYLNLPGGPTTSATVGWKLPFDMTCVALEAVSASTTNAVLRTRKNGVNQDAITAAPGTGTVATTTASDWAANDILGFISSSNTDGAVTLRATFRRRAS